MQQHAVSKVIALCEAVVGCGLLLTACAPVPDTTIATPTPSSTFTPAPSATFTPWPTSTPRPTRTPSPTPAPVTIEYRGQLVPVNTYVAEGIPIELLGEDGEAQTELINAFIFGDYREETFPSDFELKGTVLQIGDVAAYDLTCVDSPRIIRAEGDVADIFSAYEEQEDFDYDQLHSSSLEIWGTLDCHGNIEAPAQFTAEIADPYSNGFITLNDVDVSHAIFKDYVYINVTGAGTISDSTFRDTAGAALWLEGEGITLDGVEIYHSGHEGIGGTYFDTTVIANSIFDNNPSDACMVFNFLEGSPQVYGNAFSGCTSLAFLSEPTTPLDDFLDYLAQNNSFSGVKFLIEYRGTSEFIAIP